MSMKINKPCAEITESSLHSFKAQCWQWNQAPSFGQLVTVDSPTRTLFGMVYQIEMGSMDPVRYPFAYQKTHEELLQEQPQIFEFIKTTITCLTIGYMQKERMFYLIAPEPPAMHAFVNSATPEQSKRFFAHDKYLNLIFGAGQQLTHLDELLLAILKNQAELDLLTTEKITDFMQTFSLLSGNDYRRLKLFLQRAEPLITTRL